VALRPRVLSASRTAPGLWSALLRRLAGRVSALQNPRCRRPRLTYGGAARRWLPSQPLNTKGLNGPSILEPGSNMSNEVVLVEPPITTSAVGKRKGSDDLHDESGEAARKRPKKSGNSTAEPHASWPEYFQNVNSIVTSLLLCDLTHQYAALQGTSSLLCSAGSSRDETTQTFKSLNTVIAFCSSRKHLATTFSVIRSSVENIIKRLVHPAIAVLSTLTSHPQTVRPS